MVDTPLDQTAIAAPDGVERRAATGRHIHEFVLSFVAALAGFAAMLLTSPLRPGWGVLIIGLAATLAIAGLIAFASRRRLEVCTVLGLSFALTLVVWPAALLAIMVSVGGD
jgi:hypothetical protein